MVTYGNTRWLRLLYLMLWDALAAERMCPVNKIVVSIYNIYIFFDLFWRFQDLCFFGYTYVDVILGLGLLPYPTLYNSDWCSPAKRLWTYCVNTSAHVKERLATTTTGLPSSAIFVLDTTSHHTVNIQRIEHAASSVSHLVISIVLSYPSNRTRVQHCLTDVRVDRVFGASKIV